MDREPQGEVVYFQFSGISSYDWLVHGVFTRHGGVSRPPYDTLNTSFAMGDAPGAVGTNLQIIQEVLGADRLIYMKQIHGKDIAVMNHDRGNDMGGPPRADAMITDQPNLALMVKQADCQAVILLDPEKRVISAVHCGWRGNTCDILGSVVGRMRSDFGCRESDLKAAIGPSLGPCCAEFKTYREIFPANFGRFMVCENYFDLWGLSRWQLLEAGLREENIEAAGVCTRCRPDLFYSYRAEGVTGRFGTVVMLKEDGH
ncbi:MAG: peptidoglycan editing factor PgeF [Pseudomonadota bacterium]